MHDHGSISMSQNRLSDPQPTCKFYIIKWDTPIKSRRSRLTHVINEMSPIMCNLAKILKMKLLWKTDCFLAVNVDQCNNYKWDLGNITLNRKISSGSSAGQIQSCLDKYSTINASDQRHCHAARWQGTLPKRCHATLISDTMRDYVLIFSVILCYFNHCR